MIILTTFISEEPGCYFPQEIAIEIAVGAIPPSLSRSFACTQEGLRCSYTVNSLRPAPSTINIPARMTQNDLLALTMILIYPTRNLALPRTSDGI